MEVAESGESACFRLCLPAGMIIPPSADMIILFSFLVNSLNLYPNW